MVYSVHGRHIEPRHIEKKHVEMEYENKGGFVKSHGGERLQGTYIALMVLFIIIFTQNRNNSVLMKQFVKSKNKENMEDKKEMIELAKRFMEKECIIYTFNSQLTGTIKEVSEGAILIENNNSTEALNLDYIVRIKEYPRKKNGKKKSMIFDE